ncbi:MAG TPA: HAMP domain-containing sensor histidine kinase [Candidatus Baltobacteraceae bacterium]|nr:HAMP domain-containing sensor histidine kinase [Candidatus Baltobacteraceae bacterium]
MRERPLRIACVGLLAAAWALDLVSPQLFVVAILLTIPIALSSIVLDQRFTYFLIIAALAADVSAGWYNSYVEHVNIIAVGDRLLAALSIVLVGVLSIKAQQAALHAGELAERQARADVVRDLIYALSHDLRTPLAAARMTLQQALEGRYGDLPDAYKTILKSSIASNEELGRLAETLLLVARYESGEHSQMREPVDIADVARRVVTELRPLTDSKAIEVDHGAISPNSLRIEGDETEIRRAITNLVANAVTWTPHGGHIIVSTVAGNGEVSVRVADDGYGVSPAVRGMLFQRFISGARQGTGSGLGLYIVRRIAEGHCGTVTYEAAQPQGSIFTLTLPLAARDSHG